MFAYSKPSGAGAALTDTRGFRPTSHSKSKASDPVLMMEMALTARSFTITCEHTHTHHACMSKSKASVISHSIRASLAQLHIA